MTPESKGSFHATRWTLVQRAQGRGDEARLALSQLCEIYYDPVLRFTRCWSGNEDRAKDLAHGFFEDLLERKTVGSADPARGRFRNYLLSAVKHYLSRQKERETARKRGGGFDQLALDQVPEIAVSISWDQEFDQAWALALIGRALGSLHSEMRMAGKESHFEALRPWLDGGAQGNSHEVGIALELSPTALKVAIHRLRQRFRRKVREEIAATTTDHAEAAEEFRHLVDVWVRQSS